MRKGWTALAAICGTAHAATSIVGTEATPQQIVVRVRTDQPGNCTYRASEGAAFSANVNDVNPALFAGSNSDARSGSLVQGADHVFVLGARRAAQAGDAKWHSRSLRANTKHWIGVTCGADAEVSTIASTTNIPLGNTFADAYPFDANAPFGYAWPTVDFADKTKAYIDPQTGILVKRITGMDGARAAGAAPAGPTQAASAAFAPGGNWTNPANGAVLDGMNAVSTGADPLFVAMSPISTCFSTARPGSWDAAGQCSSVGDVKFRLHGSATGGANNAKLCITVDGVTCATDQKPVTLPASTGTVDYPSGPMAPYFAAWLGTQITPPATYDLATLTGTVSVAGSTVTWTGGNLFNVEKWTAGSHIQIGAASGCAAGHYTIGTVSHDKSLTLTTSAGACAGAPYTAANFGVLIYPQGGAVITLDGVSYTWDERGMFQNPQGGSSYYCGPWSKVTDSSGVSGWLCGLPHVLGAHSWYFVPDNLGANGAGARHVFSSVIPFNPDATINYGTSPEDATPQSNFFFYTGSVAISHINPNLVYALVQNFSGEWVILTAEYLPGGAGGSCTDPADYQPYSPATSSSQNCNVVFRNKTRQSEAGGTLSDRMTAFDSRFLADYFTFCRIVGARNGYLLIGCHTFQNLLSWNIAVETTSFTVVSMWPNYLNWPSRWSGTHAFGDAGDAQHASFVTQNLLNAGCALNGCGPYRLTVTAVNGEPAGTLSATSSADPSCSGVTEARAAPLLQYGSGCDQLTFTGNDPCDPDPSPYEMLVFPPCSWNENGRGLRVSSGAFGAGMGLEPGDTFYDPSAGEGKAGGETFLVAQHVSGNTWWVLRNFGLPRGPFFDSGKLSTKRAHAAGFTIEMAAGIAAADAAYWSNFVTDSKGMSLEVDRAYFPTAHGDNTGTAVFPARSIVAGFFEVANKVAFSVRAGDLPGQIVSPQTVGGPGRPSTSTGVRFGEIPGHGFTLGAKVDSHPSYRQVTARPSERDWFLDMVRLNSFTGDLYSGASLTPISGDLYRVSGFGMSAQVNVRFRPLSVWAGRRNLRDVSGPGSSIGGTAADHGKYCYVLLANECVPGSAAGQLYVNMPRASTNPNCPLDPGRNGICAIPVSPDADTVSQVGIRTPSSNGETSRTIAVPFRPWNATNIFANVHPVPDGSAAIFTCDWCNAVRTDLWWAELPPTPPADTTLRSSYVQAPISVQGKPGDQVRIRFGYAENGAPEALYCTSRAEACATDASGAQPFRWLTETQQYTACDAGCTVKVPAIPGRVVYYVVDRVNGVSSVSTELRVMAVD